MDDPLLQMAGLPGIRSLGNGPLPDDGVYHTPTERYLYNTVLLRGLMLLPLPIREIIYEHVVHYESLLSWVSTNDVTTQTVNIKETNSGFVYKQYYGVPTL
ncbi:hypothetical protein BOTNAR_0698g00010 [Botryotinia narcissicola]|uniref:Uncharacterized protein n=1 Tax=Botryotinia narcissicola TaxID=278944 RepID=A0A4Z1HCG0_9HELO|nr:hypothetical protein BOTNAR_0698g00010 [Botryotinia narcissicola]